MRFIMFSLVALAASAALAEDPAAATPPPTPPPPAPTADEINRVTAYYLHGKDGGPIMLEFKLCAAIGKNAENKNTCDGELGDTIKKGDAIVAYVRFFAPKGGKYEDLSVRFSHNGEMKSTSTFSVTESWTGYSNYKRNTAGKVGAWDVEVLQGDKVIAKKTVNAH